VAPTTVSGNEMLVGVTVSADDAITVTLTAADVDASKIKLSL
jgi:predicted phage tail protein